ncbi:MAG: DUF2142 domain-containing protein [Salinibacterium sp.]|nr:DUF2142 domain-containing protein [Salinibacterium sp.]MBF0673469.1 DUF2142 domain-containing protein [Salinibacterium sp.]
MKRLRLRAIHLAPLLAIAALLGWAFASPVGASPDDDFHLVSTWCASGDELCEETPVDGVREVPTALVQVPCYAAQEKESAACQSAIDFSVTATETTSRGNFNSEYPPVFYAVMGLFAGDDIIASALTMRVVSVLIFVALTSVTFALLPASRRQTLTLMWLATTLPMGAFLIASNNPSGWAIAGVGTGWIALLGYLEGHGRRKWALGAMFALSALMAAGSRGDAALYMLVAIGAVFLLTVPKLGKGADRKAFIAYGRDAILPAAVAVLCVILFFSSRQAATGLTGFGPPTAAPGGVGEDIVPVEAKEGLTLALSNLLHLPLLWAGNFGEWGLGWFDTVLPPTVLLASIAALSVTVFVGLGRTWGRKLLVVGLAGAAMVLVPIFVLQQGGNVVGEQVQPRYVLPIIILFVGLSLLSRRESVLRLTRTQAFVLGIGLVAAFFVSMRTNMRRYITGVDVRTFSLDVSIEWWWDLALSPNAVWIGASLAYAALVAILLVEVRAPVDEPAVPAPDPAPAPYSERGKVAA